MQVSTKRLPGFAISTDAGSSPEGDWRGAGLVSPLPSANAAEPSAEHPLPEEVAPSGGASPSRSPSATRRRVSNISTGLAGSDSEALRQRRVSCNSISIDEGALRELRLFADAAEMERLATPQEDSDEESVSQPSWRTKLRHFIASTRFSMFVGAMIMVNTVVLGVELDQHELAQAEEGMISFVLVRLPPVVFEAFEVGFFIIFGIELLLRVVVYRFAVLKDGWTYIDLAALSPVVLIYASSMEGSKSMMMLRVVRLLKLCRLLRLVRLFKELHVLALSIVSALKALVWIGLLLVITVYCAAIFCTTLIGHNLSFRPDDPKILEYEATYDTEVNSRRFWGSIMRSMFTLFQIFTLDDWNDVVRPVVETHQPMMSLFFVVFLFVTTFGLLNLLMGTIVDRAMTVAREADMEREKALSDENKQVILVAVRLFALMDKDSNGHLSGQEITDFLEANDLQDIVNKELKGFKINIDYMELMDICQSIVEEWVDPDAGENENAGITMEEFAGAAMRLQGSAKSKDLLSMMIMQKSTLGRVESCERVMGRMESQQEAVGFKLDHMLQLMSGKPSSLVAKRAFGSAPSIHEAEQSRASHFDPIGTSLIAFKAEAQEPLSPSRTSSNTSFASVRSSTANPGSLASVRGSTTGGVGGNNRRRVNALLDEISEHQDFAKSDAVAAMRTYNEKRSKAPWVQIGSDAGVLAAERQAAIFAAERQSPTSPREPASGRGHVAEIFVDADIPATSLPPSQLARANSLERSHSRDVVSPVDPASVTPVSPVIPASPDNSPRAKRSYSRKSSLGLGSRINSILESEDIEVPLSPRLPRQSSKTDVQLSPRQKTEATWGPASPEVRLSPREKTKATWNSTSQSLEWASVPTTDTPSTSQGVEGLPSAIHN